MYIYYSIQNMKKSEFLKPQITVIYLLMDF